jgi:hypothetical protein
MIGHGHDLGCPNENDESIDEEGNAWMSWMTHPRDTCPLGKSRPKCMWTSEKGCIRSKAKRRVGWEVGRLYK